MEKQTRIVCDICRRNSDDLEPLPIRQPHGSTSKDLLMCPECKANLPTPFQNEIDDADNRPSKTAKQLLTNALRILCRFNSKFSGIQDERSDYRNSRHRWDPPKT